MLNIKFIFPTLSSSQVFQSRKSTQTHKKPNWDSSGTVWSCGFTFWPHLSVWKPSHGRKKGVHLKGGWFCNQNKTSKDISILVKNQFLTSAILYFQVSRHLFQFFRKPMFAGKYWGHKDNYGLSWTEYGEGLVSAIYYIQKPNFLEVKLKNYKKAQSS